MVVWSPVCPARVGKSPDVWTPLLVRALVEVVAMPVLVALELPVTTAG